MTAIDLLAAAGFASGGLALGLVYFAALRRSIAFLIGEGGLRLGVGLTIIRLAAATGAFLAVGQAGLVPLLAAFGGFLAARQLSLSMGNAS